MRVLFATSPFKSHLQPMVPLAWALRSAGHEVRVASEPGFLDTITQTGLTAVAVGPDQGLEQRIRSFRGEVRSKRDLEAFLAPPSSFSADALYEMGNAQRDGLSWESVTWLLRIMVVPQTWLVNDVLVEDLVAYCRFWQPDLVLCDVLTHAGAVAADAVGAAHARLLFWLDVTHRLRRDFLRAQERQPPGKRQDMLRDWYAEWARKYGRDFTEELITGQFAVNVLPERCRLEPHERTLSLRHVPYNDGFVEPPWLHTAPRMPRVLMTFGISVRQWADLPCMSVEQVQETLDALADLDIELVLTVSDEARDQLRRVPDNTRIVEFVPLDVILPTCSVVIHHGGAGTFNGTLVHGIPQLVVGYAADAPGKGILLRQTGIGLFIAPDEVSGPLVREYLTRLLEDGEFRAASERLQQEALAQPTPSALVPDLERFTAEYRSRRGAG